MDVYVYYRCGNCGHRVPGPGMERVHLRGKRVLICGECYRELVAKRTGYRQAKLEFEGQVDGYSEELPF